MRLLAKRNKQNSDFTVKLRNSFNKLDSMILVDKRIKFATAEIKLYISICTKESKRYIESYKCFFFTQPFINFWYLRKIEGKLPMLVVIIVTITNINPHYQKATIVIIAIITINKKIYAQRM